MQWMSNARRNTSAQHSHVFHVPLSGASQPYLKDEFSLAEHEKDPIHLHLLSRFCRTEAEDERKRGTTERGGSPDDTASPKVTSSSRLPPSKAISRNLCSVRRAFVLVIACD